MPSVQARRKATQRRAVSKQRKRVKVRNRINGAIARARVMIAKRRKLIRQDDGAPGVRAVRAALTMVGKVENNNDAPWLHKMENDLPHDRLDWMVPGNPYCGLGVIWSWWVGAKKELPDGYVYTPNICGGGAYGRKVSAYDAKPGDSVVFHFGSGGAKHVGLARGPAKNGVIPTVEFNTSPSDAGSQGNGGGVWPRNRSLGLVLCVVRP